MDGSGSAGAEKKATDAERQEDDDDNRYLFSFVAVEQRRAANILSSGE